MSLLEQEILKYEKRGFTVAQRRTLKHGSRIFLKKEREGFFSSGFEGIYIYYTESGSSTDSIRECLKDYEKFYEAQEFGEGDKGFYLCASGLDEKLFKDLRKAMISDEDIRSSIKPMVTSKGTVSRPAPPETLPNRKSTERAVNFNEVVRLIKSHPLVPRPKERDYEAQLYSALTSSGYPVEYEGQRKGSRFDLIIGDDDIAVELKIVKNASIFNSLLGQVMRYKRQVNKIIIVLVDQFRNPSIMNREIEQLRNIDLDNIEVIIK